MPIDASQLRTLAGDLGKISDEMLRTEVKAVNKALITIRKASQQEIRKDSPLKAAWVRNAIKPTRAVRRARVVLSVREKGIPIRVRGPSSIKDPWYKATKLKSGVLKAKITKARPKALKKGFSHDHIAGTIALRRTTSKRYPLRTVYGPSVFRMFQRRNVQLEMDRTWRHRVPVEMRRAEDFVLRKYGLI